MIWWLVGAVVFFAGIMFSIALHELGHLSFAKLFKVRTTQYMVGFGGTLWSRQRGETEYGIKWIPFGGYIRMIGMLPPRKEDEPGTVRRLTTGPFQGLIDSARGAALEEVTPTDGNRVFYAKPWWQKVLIMTAGPAMNIMLAAVFFAIVLMGFGALETKTTISVVNKCVVAANTQPGCDNPQSKAAPAAQAGLRPGDTFLSFGGTTITSGEQLRDLIRGSAGKNVPVVVRRGGQDVSLTMRPIANQVPSETNPNKMQTVGFLGVVFERELVPQGPGAVATQLTDMGRRTVIALVHMPEKMVGVAKAAFGGERDPEGPVGIVGVSRINGEYFASKAPSTDKLVFFLQLLASFNFAVGVFNLIPLLPLDGGHIAGGLWEGLKRGFARVTRRPDPGHVDVAKALPLAYGMATILIVMGVLLAYADVVNPIKLGG
jgi:membrane-associated protease RseP (regulator of RpoE activity)